MFTRYNGNVANGVFDIGFFKYDTNTGTESFDRNQFAAGTIISPKTLSFIRRHAINSRNKNEPVTVSLKVIDAKDRKGNDVKVAHSAIVTVKDVSYVQTNTPSVLKTYCDNVDQMLTTAQSTFNGNPVVDWVYAPSQSGTKYLTVIFKRNNKRVTRAFRCETHNTLFDRVKFD